MGCATEDECKSKEFRETICTKVGTIAPLVYIEQYPYTIMFHNWYTLNLLLSISLFKLFSMFHFTTVRFKLKNKLSKITCSCFLVIIQLYYFNSARFKVKISKESFVLSN